jgi:hypothetical protein
MLRPSDLYEIYKAIPLDEIFSRFSKNPNLFKLLKSTKDTIVAFYYTKRGAELSAGSEERLSNAYYSIANNLLDTWEWLGFKRKK